VNFLDAAHNEMVRERQLVEQAKRLSEDIMTERIKVCFCCLTCCTKFYK